MKEIILTNEIADERVDKFSEIPKLIQNKIREQNCVNCYADFGEEDIRYVICKNGKVRWWCMYHGDTIELEKRQIINNNRI